MNFNNRIKGSVTQGIIEVLLKDAGYNIVPLGIEEIIRELQLLTPIQYTSLNLSNTLRSLPDFFVSEPDFAKTYLVEVKYRSKWSNRTKDSLKETIEEQVKQWQPVFLILFLGEKARDSETPASYLGVLKLAHKDNELGAMVTRVNHGGGLGEYTTTEVFKPWDQIDWNDFKRFHDVFLRVSDSFEASTISKSVDLVKGLKEILVK